MGPHTVGPVPTFSFPPPTHRVGGGDGKGLERDAAICGDVIVGFPGETEEQFQNTLALIREVRFDMLNTYAYSPRPNTEAALWEDQVWYPLVAQLGPSN